MGPKWSRPKDHTLYIGLYRENYEKIFLSETIRPRALIFGMKHHLVDLYQVNLNCAPGAKNDSALGITCFTYNPRARNRFNQVVEAKRFEGVFLCRKVC